MNTMDMLIFSLAAIALTVVAVIFAVQLSRAFRRFQIRKTYSLKNDLPSVTVCIPARNETHAMTQCLENLLASDYEKLEIIVFDDNSADNTSVLVKSFAHAGVRFVAGSDLPEGWLGKNHALDVLAHEASGTYVLFMSVDTLVQPTTISQVVKYAVGEKLDMVSVLPQRNDTWRASVLFAPLRYFWQLVFSSSNAPATSSAFWMISRKVLQEELGGIKAFKTSVQPEAAIAFSLHSKRAHTLISTKALGVSYEKRWRSQVETSQRLLYPMAGGTWWKAFAAFTGLLVLNIPFFTLLSALLLGWTEIQITAFWFICVFSGLYALYANRMWRSKWWLAGILWSYVIFQELCLFVYSIWGYATKSITWKGRPVTILSRVNN